MNSLFLLLAATVAFVFGYRFYSRLLTVEVFRLKDTYSIPSDDRPVEAIRHGVKHHMIAGQHVASLAAGAAVLGCIIALNWGWVPAFLWVVVGTVTAAGTYGLGTLWLSLRYPGLNAAEVCARLLGAHARTAFALFAMIILLILCAASASFAAHLLTAFPRAVLPFWIVVVLAYFLGSFLRGREEFEIIPAALIAITLGMMAIGLLGEFPLSFTGAILLESGTRALVLDAKAVWIAILFVYAYHATRQPTWKMIRPRGFLTALLLLILLFICLLAVVIDRPVLTIADYYTGSDRPGTLPWLFLTLTSGAMAGVHLLVANGITARQMKRETDARYIGYGGGIVLGLLALSAVIIGGIGYTGVPEWPRALAPADGLRDLNQAFEIYIFGFAKLAAGLGMSLEYARTLAAVVMLGLLTATLEAGLRVQKQLLTGLAEHYPSFLPAKEKSQIVTVVSLTAAVALAGGIGSGIPIGWTLYGVADLMLAVIGFTLLVLALRRQGQPFIWVLLPLLFMVVVAHWALFAQLALWWSAQAWTLFGLGLTLLMLELVLAWLAVTVWSTPSAAAT